MIQHILQKAPYLSREQTMSSAVCRSPLPTASGEVKGRGKTETLGQGPRAPAVRCRLTGEHLSLRFDERVSVA